MTLDVYLEQLQKLIKRKVSYKEIAPILKLSSDQAVSNRIQRKQKLKPYEIENLNSCFKVNILLTDKTQEDKLSNDFMSIPYYKDIMASCGKGNLMLDEEPEVERYPISIKYGLNPNNKYFLINATGDSMEKTIFDKELVILENWVNKQIVDDKIYFFSYNKEYYLKRLSKNIDTIQISSDNKILNDLGNLKYPDKVLKGEDLNNIVIYGRFKGKIEKD